MSKHIDNYPEKVAEIVGKIIPQLQRLRIGVATSIDPDGLDCLSVIVTFEKRPRDADAFRHKRFRVIEAFRSWLDEQGDDRYPYFTFRTASEQNEIAAERAKHG